MKNTNFKEIVDYIEKYAVAAPHRVSPTAKPSAGATPSVYAPSVSGAAGNAEIPEVLEMQNAIKALGSIVRSKPIKETKFERGEGFSDWLATQHMETSKIHGKEWTHEEARSKVEEKQPTEIIQLKYVINSLGRIGPGNREINSDGRWGPRTQNAIKNVYAFGDALVNVVTAFNIAGFTPSFTKADLTALEAAIPTVDDPRTLKVSELKQKASVATPLIKKLTDLYTTYDKKIIQSPRYALYLSEKKPLFTVKPTKAAKTPLQQQFEKSPDKDKMSLVVDFNINTRDLLLKKTVSVPISVLQTKSSFQRFLMEKLDLTAGQVKNIEIQKLALQSVTNALEKAKEKKIPWLKTEF